MLKILMGPNVKILIGPNVKILMGQSFGSWTHGHGPTALGAWAAAARPRASKEQAGHSRHGHHIADLDKRSTSLV